MNRSYAFPLVCAGLTAAFFVATVLLWLFAYPQMLSYQEQYQLFLFTFDYFSDRMSLPGGLADYVSEFIVQFYYVPWAGALLIGAVMAMIQVLLGAVLLRVVAARGARLAVWCLAAIPSVLLTCTMGDVNFLMSYPVAILLTLLAAYIALRVRMGVAMSVVTMALGFPLLYWWVGPVAVLFPLLLCLLSPVFSRRWLWVLATAAWAALVIGAFSRLLYVQYPESQLVLGINYFRVTNQHPAYVWAIPGVIVLLALAAMALRRERPLLEGYALGWSSMLAVAVMALVVVPRGFDRDVMSVLRYDMLTRHERWADIIALAENDPPKSDFCLQAVNLALAKTGQMGERMFEFDQHGISSLISRYRLDNTTCLVSAEVFYHLGMVNSAFRYNFDLQESIMNDRRSGRFLKRMVECQIINHQYRVAAKYTDMLKKSLFYSDWARRAEELMAAPDRTDQVGVWAEKRRQRFSREMLYDYDEIEKMLGLLAIEGDRNPLAWDYFNAALMLKGDLATMAGMYHYAREKYGLSVIPRHHQQAIALYWTFGHQDFAGLPYPVSDGVKRDIASLARVYSQNAGHPEVWQRQFKDNYCVYFLSRQISGAAQPETPSVKGAERED